MPHQAAVRRPAVSRGVRVAVVADAAHAAPRRAHQPPRHGMMMHSLVKLF